MAAALAAAPPCTAGTCPEIGLDAAISAGVPGISSWTLSNGLRVHVVSRPSDPTVAVRVVYDVGARDEAEGASGTAHLFEHLMFKGSRQLGDGDVFRIARDVGGRIGAMTLYDTTEYWTTVPVEALERVLFAEADRMRGLRITPVNLANQRAAIEEEKNQLLGVPYVAAAERFGLELWAGTPYGHSPIGSLEELATMDVERAARFHRTWYRPANAVLVLVGPVTEAAAREAVDATFGQLPSGPARPEREAFVLDRSPLQRAIDDPYAPFPAYAVVWHGVAATHPDALAVALIDDLLMNPDGGRLRRRVVRPFAFDGYALAVALRDVGLLNYVFAPRTFASFAEIVDGVRAEARVLREEGPSDEELCRSRRQEQRERLAALDDAERLAAAIGLSAVLHGEPLHFLSEARRLEGIDADEVRRVAGEILVEESPTLEIRPVGAMRWIKPILEVLPAALGRSLEGWLL